MFISGMLGMGDNIYQRSIIRELECFDVPIYLKTSWPQLYSDLSFVYPVKPISKLINHNKNVARQPETTWYSTDGSKEDFKISYSFRNNDFSILETFEKIFNMKAQIFDLPIFDSSENMHEKYAVIRPVTVRKEWYNSARNPIASYVDEAANILIDKGYKVVSVADIDGINETALNEPNCHLQYNRGELTFEQLMSLIQKADVVVGGIGWITPASIAANVPLINILGGQGDHNSPERLISSPMNIDKVRWIYPDEYCRCSSVRHNCNKVISSFEEKFTSALESLC